MYKKRVNVSNILINKYWENFYKKKKIDKASSFAKFLCNYLNNKNNLTIADIACGDGRDTIFFLKKGFKVYSFDQSKVIIKLNKIKIGKNFYFLNFCGKTINIKKKFDVCYIRFFIHAITEPMEKKFLKNLKTVSKKNTLFFFEFRTTKDPLIRKGIKISNNERFTTHYRRFIQIKELIKNLRKNKFKVIYKKSSSRFSVTRNDIPHICRLIVKNV